MLNGQLKPGYNIQVGTENNFVIGYDVFPNPTDTRTFIPHLENVQKRLGCKFKFAIADAGYGSEENYDYLECEVIKMSDSSDYIVGNIINVSADESILTDGKIDVAKLKPICYDPVSHNYNVLGQIVGKAFSDGKAIK